jgi:uncharacterized protein YggU (UPF0235/DUF167 family)
VIPLSCTPAGVSFRVRVVPRAGRSGVTGERGDALLIRLAAAPVDVAANEALIAMLAGILGCPKRGISIVGGERARDKVVRITGMDIARVSAKLVAILSP